MSWQAYVDTNLVGTGKIAKAAIIGQDGSSWACSQGFNVRLRDSKLSVYAGDVTSTTHTLPCLH
jgi:profilin